MNPAEAARAAGVVGAGGAGFPTHVKLSAKADCFIVNAAECEPLIETDKYIMRQFPDKIIAAIEAVSAHLGAKDAVIALKHKYIAETAALKGAVLKAKAPIRLFEMPSFYPAGDEQTLVHLICGVSVPERGIPLDVGAVVNNVGTLLNIYDAMKGLPVTDKYLSVVGAVSQPVMLRVPIGTPVAACIAAAQPAVSGYCIVLGGPMMGNVCINPDEIASLPVTKTTGNIIVLPREHYLARRADLPLSRIRARAASACVQCRMCTGLCPRYQIGHRMRPHLVMRNLFREHLIADDEEYERAFGDAANCSECGVCEMFSCPMGLSPRKVNQYIKGRLRERGIQVGRNKNPVPRSCSSHGQIPTDRLVARLGLTDYYRRHVGQCVELMPEEVVILFGQHIGKPAAPVKRAGDAVAKGELLAAAAEGGLSANIHASIDGVIVGIDEAGAVIRRSGKE